MSGWRLIIPSRCCRRRRRRGQRLVAVLQQRRAHAHLRAALLHGAQLLALDGVYASLVAYQLQKQKEDLEESANAAAAASSGAAGGAGGGGGADGGAAGAAGGCDGGGDRGARTGRIKLTAVIFAHVCRAGQKQVSVCAATYWILACALSTY